MFLPIIVRIERRDIISFSIRVFLGVIPQKLNILGIRAGLFIEDST